MTIKKQRVVPVVAVVPFGIWCWLLCTCRPLKSLADMCRSCFLIVCPVVGVGQQLAHHFLHGSIEVLTKVRIQAMSSING